MGARLAFGDAVFKPYAKVDYTDAKLKGFTETGVDGVALDVAGGNYRRASTELGASLSEQLGRIAPQVSVGWRHLYGHDTAIYHAAFDLAPGSDFSVVSAAQGHNAAVVGAASTVDLGHGATIKFSYQGSFATHGHDNSGALTLSVPFGGR